MSSSSSLRILSSSLHLLARSPIPQLRRQQPVTLHFNRSSRQERNRSMLPTISAVSTPHLGPVLQQLVAAFQTSPATWKSSILSNLVIFTIGSPLLAAGLSLPGTASAFLLGTLTWRSFGSSGFLLVVAYFLVVSF